MLAWAARQLHYSLWPVELSENILHNLFHKLAPQTVCDAKTNLSDLLVALRAGDARDEDVPDVVAEVAWRREVVGKVVQIGARHQRGHTWVEVRLRAFLEKKSFHCVELGSF